MSSTRDWEKSQKPFQNLRGLFIEKSKLKIITGDVLRYMKNLEELSLKENQIVYVEADIFKPLANLRSMNFFSNICYSTLATGTLCIKYCSKTIEDNCNIFHRYVDDYDEYKTTNSWFWIALSIKINLTSFLLNFVRWSTSPSYTITELNLKLIKFDI